MKKVEQEYIQLKTELASMCQVATSMLQDVTTALVTRDTALAENVIQRDDEVDVLDTRIDEHCLKMLALYEPKAIDLRFVVTALRIIVDLERVGDHCTNIAVEVKQLNQSPPIKPYIDLPKMAEATIGMIQDAITAYFNKDVDAALEIIQRDDIIDQFDDKITEELLSYMGSDLTNTRNVISLLFIVRSIERIADYATNIAEMIYFMATGEIIKHRTPDKGTDG
ncbi:MAG: phosphate transport system regulatory protein PhoU [Desulfobacteraceae bacterium 4572_35.1]|nr:MAG: phosphate transport system regulatory protein PhoU [Desulfobacteraceae bacterium 4572_35.1]